MMIRSGRKVAGLLFCLVFGFAFGVAPEKNHHGHHVPTTNGGLGSRRPPNRRALPHDMVRQFTKVGGEGHVGVGQQTHDHQYSDVVRQVNRGRGMQQGKPVEHAARNHHSNMARVLARRTNAQAEDNSHASKVKKMLMASQRAGDFVYQQPSPKQHSAMNPAWLLEDGRGDELDLGFTEDLHGERIQGFKVSGLQDVTEGEEASFEVTATEGLPSGSRVLYVWFSARGNDDQRAAFFAVPAAIWEKSKFGNATFMNSNSETATVNFKAMDPGTYEVHVILAKLRSDSGQANVPLEGSPWKIEVQKKDQNAGIPPAAARTAKALTFRVPQKTCRGQREPDGRWLRCDAAGIRKEECLRDGWVFVPHNCRYKVYTPTEIMEASSRTAQSRNGRPLWFAVLSSSIDRGDFHSLIDYIGDEELLDEDGELSTLRRFAFESESKGNPGKGTAVKCWGWSDMQAGNFRFSFQDFRSPYIEQEEETCREKDEHCKYDQAYRAGSLGRLKKLMSENVDLIWLELHPDPFRLYVVDIVAKAIHETRLCGLTNNQRGRYRERPTNYPPLTECPAPGVIFLLVEAFLVRVFYESWWGPPRSLENPTKRPPCVSSYSTPFQRIPNRNSRVLALWGDLFCVKNCLLR